MEIINSISIAISLSIDACLLAVAYGLIDIKKKQILITSVMVGVFHYIMPLIGNNIFYVFFSKLNINSTFILLVILLILGFQILKENKEEENIKFTIITPIIFSILVSIDSLFIGIGLNAVSSNIKVTLAIFSITSFIFTLLGFTFSHFIKKKFEKQLEIISVIIIFTLIAYFFVKIIIKV